MDTKSKSNARYGDTGKPKAEDIRGAVILYGSCDFIRDEFQKAVIDARIPPEDRIMNLVTYDGRGLSGSQVRQAVETYPFFGDSRVAVVRGFTDMSDEEQGIVAGMIEAGVPEYATLILTAAGVDKRKKLFTTVQKAGRTLEFLSPQGNDLRIWMRERLREEGVSLSKEAGEYLIERDGQDLRTLLNDIRKISLMWTGEDRMLSLEDIRDLVGGIPEQDVFQMLEMVSAGNGEGAIMALRRCLDGGQEPWAIIPHFIRQFRTILYCKELSGKGMSTEEIASAAGVHPYSAKLCQGHARRFSESELMMALCRLSALDLAIKSSRMEPREGMELFIAETLK